MAEPGRRSAEPDGTAAAPAPPPWSDAWTASLRTRSGFWSHGPGLAGPAAHFRTSAHVGAVLADALLVVLHELDERLGRPARLDLVDVGAGGGELLTAVLQASGTADDDLATRLALVGVDLLPRPAGLDERVRWVQGEAPDAVPSGVVGLLVAHEWLDELPVEVVEVVSAGVRRVLLVEPDGTQVPGPQVEGVDAAWLDRWWPVREVGERAESGMRRDAAWRECLRRLDAGAALAVDYGHTRDEREAGRFASGTLTGYLDGRTVEPRPDGSVDLTAHVAIDALADASRSEAPGGRVSVLRQREALRALGVSAALPDRALASSDPAAYADALERASQASELLDPAGLGAFHWLRVDR